MFWPIFLLLFWASGFFSTLTFWNLMLWPTPSPKKETINIESIFLYCTIHSSFQIWKPRTEEKEGKEFLGQARTKKYNFFCSANRKECVRKKGRRDLSFVRTSFSNTLSSLLLFIFFLFNKSHFALFFFLWYFFLQQLSICNRTLYYFLSLFTCLFLFLMPYHIFYFFIYFLQSYFVSFVSRRLNECLFC